MRGLDDSEFGAVALLNALREKPGVPDDVVETVRLLVRARDYAEARDLSIPWLANDTQGKHEAGPEHEQSSHGNWAHGGGTGESRTVLDRAMESLPASPVKASQALRQKIGEVLRQVQAPNWNDDVAAHLTTELTADLQVDHEMVRREALLEIHDAFRATHDNLLVMGRAMGGDATAKALLDLMEKDETYRAIVKANREFTLATRREFMDQRVTVGPEMPEVNAKVKEVEDRVRDDFTETLTVLEEDGTVVIQDEGVSNQVPLTDTMKGLMADRIVTHNHPSSRAFSPEDIVTAARYRVREMRVVTPDGSVHRMRPGSYTETPAGMYPERINNWPEDQKVEDAFFEVGDKVQRELYRRINKGEIHANEASQLHHFLVMQEAARKLGLIYEFTPGEEA